MAVACGQAVVPTAAIFPRGCRDRACMRQRAISNEVAPQTDCSCAQDPALVVVRGRTTAAEEGLVDFCSKGGTFDSAAPGDFVACPANTPRRMNGAVLVEPDAGPLLRINYLLTASQFDSDWAQIGVVSAAPVVVPDQAIGPSGTMTADLVTFDATTLGIGLSALVKATGSSTTGHCPVVAHASAQVYVMGTTLDGGSTSGTLGMGIYDGSAYQSVLCSYTGAAFTRCKKENVDSSGASGGNFYIGNASLLTGGTLPAQSVFLAMASCEEGTNVSSPIDDTSVLANGQVWTRMPDQVEPMSIARTAWIGDSLSANTVASTSSTQVYPRAPERYAADSSRTVDNWAIDGAELVSNCELQWTNWAQRSNPGQLVILCGINDIIIGGANGHTLWSTLQSFLTALSPMPAKIVLLNLLPFGNYSGWTSTEETQRLNFNSDMAAYCGGAGPGTVCVDSNSAMWDPSNHANLNPTFAAPDNLHLNQVGANALGDTVFGVAP